MLDPAGAPSAETGPLLEADEAAPFELVNEQARAPVLLVCDHASNRIPRRLDGLGLGAAALADHIAWDIGAAALTRALSARLRVPAVLSGYSRLVIDCNRPLDDPTSIVVESDGITIPGNRGLGPAAAAGRAQACFWPYHRAIAGALDRWTREGRVPAVIAIHSFTPSLGGARRPWHVGVLWGWDGRLAGPLVGALRAIGGLVVGDNEPYSGRLHFGYTVQVHGAARGFPHVQIEVRQDLVADEACAHAWAELLAGPVAAALADERIYRSIRF